MADKASAPGLGADPGGRARHFPRLRFEPGVPALPAGGGDGFPGRLVAGGGRLPGTLDRLAIASPDLRRKGGPLPGGARTVPSVAAAGGRRDCARGCPGPDRAAGGGCGAGRATVPSDRLRQVNREFRHATLVGRAGGTGADGPRPLPSRPELRSTRLEGALFPRARRGSGEPVQHLRDAGRHDDRPQLGRDDLRRAPGLRLRRRDALHAGGRRKRLLAAAHDRHGHGRLRRTAPQRRGGDPVLRRVQRRALGRLRPGRRRPSGGGPLADGVPLPRLHRPRPPAVRVRRRRGRAGGNGRLADRHVHGVGSGGPASAGLGRHHSHVGRRGGGRDFLPWLVPGRPPRLLRHRVPDRRRRVGCRRARLPHRRADGSRAVDLVQQAGTRHGSEFDRGSVHRGPCRRRHRGRRGLVDRVGERRTAGHRANP